MNITDYGNGATLCTQASSPYSIPGKTFGYSESTNVFSILVVVIEFLPRNTITKTHKVLISSNFHLFVGLR